MIFPLKIVLISENNGDVKEKEKSRKTERQFTHQHSEQL